MLIMNKRKGMASIIGIFAIIAAIVGGTNMVQLQVSAEEMIQFNMDDMETISEASFYGNYYRDQFIPRAIRLSEYESAYRIGKRESDTENITWYNSGGNDVADMSDRDARVHAWQDLLKPNMASRIASFVDRSREVIGCSIDIRGKELMDNSGIGEEDSPSYLESIGFEGDGYIECDSEAATAKYSLGYIEEDSHTRYIEAVEDSFRFSEALEENLGEELEDFSKSDLRGGDSEEDSYTKNERAIDDSVERLSFPSDEKRSIRQDVKEVAKSESREEVRQNVSDAVEKAKDVEDSFHEDMELTFKSWELEGDYDVNEDSEPSREINPGGSGDYTATYQVDATFDPEKIVLRYKVKDNKRDILTSDGVNPLVMNSEYIHEIELSSDD